MNKRELYESIMRNVAKEVKKALNEEYIEDSDYSNALKWLNDKLESVRDSWCEEYLKKSDNANGKIGYDALDRLISTLSNDITNKKWPNKK